MGPEQAASVLTQVKKDGMTEAAAKKYKEQITEQYETQASSIYATARLWDDGIITPQETRTSLALALAVNTPEDLSKEPRYGVFRM